MWVDEIPLVGEDGSTNVSFSLFLISFTLIVSWLVLQLSTIVLLDNYVKAPPPPRPAARTLRTLRYRRVPHEIHAELAY